MAIERVGADACRGNVVAIQWPCAATVAAFVLFVFVFPDDDDDDIKDWTETIEESNDGDDSDDEIHPIFFNDGDFVFVCVVEYEVNAWLKFKLFNFCILFFIFSLLFHFSLLLLWPFSILLLSLLLLLLIQSILRLCKLLLWGDMMIMLWLLWVASSWWKLMVAILLLWYFQLTIWYCTIIPL